MNKRLRITLNIKDARMKVNHVTGMSYGALLACMYALRFPGRLGKAVLLGPACHRAARKPRFYNTLHVLLMLVPGAGHDMLAVHQDFIMEKIMEFLKP